jgi:hypothetical protein
MRSAIGGVAAHASTAGPRLTAGGTRGRLTPAAHRLSPQARSQLVSTARAANAGRRLFAVGHRPTAVQVQRRTRLVAVGRRRPLQTRLPPANSAKSRSKRSLVRHRSVWFDPSRAHPRLRLVERKRPSSWCAAQGVTVNAPFIADDTSQWKWYKPGASATVHVSD